MGRITTSVEINNPFEPGKALRCDALVDTGASHMILPRAWKDRLGTVPMSSKVEMETADQTSIGGEVCGPFTIQLEGFRPVSGEVLFIDMHPDNGAYEPLLGYLVLEALPAAVDMLGHRLVPVKRLDLK
jgi:predicted aspartyl protease